MYVQFPIDTTHCTALKDARGSFFYITQVLGDHWFVQLIVPQLNQWRQRSCTAYGWKARQSPPEWTGIWLYNICIIWEKALSRTVCHHCGDMSLSSLRLRLAFFSETNPAPRALPPFSSQGPERKRQQGRGFQHLEMSEFSPAVNPRTSLSLHREIYAVLFTHPDQHPSVATSDLVSFGGSNDGELDDSLSLAASDFEELAGSYNDPAPSQSVQPSASSPGMDTDLFRILSSTVEELGLEWSPTEEPSRSRLAEWFLTGRRQAPRQ